MSTGKCVEMARVGGVVHSAISHYYRRAAVSLLGVYGKLFSYECYRLYGVVICVV